MSELRVQNQTKQSATLQLMLTSDFEDAPKYEKLPLGAGAEATVSIPGVIEISANAILSGTTYITPPVVLDRGGQTLIAELVQQPQGTYQFQLTQLDEGADGAITLRSTVASTVIFSIYPDGRQDPPIQAVVDTFQGSVFSTGTLILKAEVGAVPSNQIEIPLPLNDVVVRLVPSDEGGAPQYSLQVSSGREKPPLTASIDE